jgi:hypothetical protein
LGGMFILYAIVCRSTFPWAGREAGTANAGGLYPALHSVRS